jgi:hypothetical protein
MNMLGKELERVLGQMIKELQSDSGSLFDKDKYVWLSETTIKDSQSAKRVWAGVQPYNQYIRYINIASGLLKALKDSGMTYWNLVTVFCQKLKNPDVLAYIDYLLTRPSKPFRITEVNHPEASASVQMTLKQFPLARLAIAKRVIAVMLTNIWQSLITEITYKNHLKFTPSSNTCESEGGSLGGIGKSSSSSSSITSSTTKLGVLPENELTVHPIDVLEARNFLTTHSTPHAPQKHFKKEEEEEGADRDEEVSDSPILLDTDLLLLKEFCHYHNQPEEGYDFYEYDNKNALWIAAHGKLETYEVVSGKIIEREAKEFTSLETNYVNFNQVKGAVADPPNNQIVNPSSSVYSKAEEASGIKTSPSTNETSSAQKVSLGQSHEIKNEEEEKAATQPKITHSLSNLPKPQAQLQSPPKKSLLMTEVNAKFYLKKKTNSKTSSFQGNQPPGLIHMEGVFTHHLIQSAFLPIKNQMNEHCSLLREETPNFISRGGLAGLPNAIKSSLNLDFALTHNETQSTRLIEHFMREDNLIVETVFSMKNLLSSDEWDIYFEWKGLEAIPDVQSFYVLSCYLCANTGGQNPPNEEVSRILEKSPNDPKISEMLLYLRGRGWSWDLQK